MEITIKPIIRDNEFMPDAPITRVIILEMLSRIKITMETARIEVMTKSLSVSNEYA